MEKFKILPKSAPAKKGDEEKKSEEKKISMGKGYFSLEEASFNDSTVFTIVCAFKSIYFLTFMKLGMVFHRLKDSIFMFRIYNYIISL